MGSDTSMRIKKEVKEKLLNLDFVKRQSENDLVLYLIKFYEKHKNEILAINTKGEIYFGKKRKKVGKYGKTKQ